MAVYRLTTGDKGNVGRRENLMALPAPVFQEYVTRLPFFDADPGFIKFQIDYPTHKPLFTDDVPASARSTAFAWLRYRRGERKSPFSLWGTSHA